jgi:hypothetical protein
LVVSNQIKTVFDLEYKGHVNLKEYDWIRQYYFQPKDFDDNDTEMEDDN